MGSPLDTDRLDDTFPEWRRAAWSKERLTRFGLVYPGG
jgi:hypothetical protein